ncbi:EF-hand domain-containing protein [Tropicimonas isoalkanivorans]|uniref:EF hand n=1 Tax=Tropicimonas isoalkanivorans TaxID=441112 RepID=A0A1I1LAS1_9RHOB|nr:EF-hand domain-containing protein [Tropicimonas isoalkanivorans]SFC70237.1 EF hand [Tropicimonas isoalkanivorans]
MTRIILLTTAIAAGLMVADTADAIGGGQGPLNRPSFSELDADGDGKLTRAEMQAMPAAMAAARFRAADRNGDGKIDAAELAASLGQARSTRNPARADVMLSRFDSNGDGAIGRSEMTAAIGRNRSGAPGDRFMAWADTDRDGAISAAEYAAAADRIRPRAGQRNGGWNGGQRSFWRN